MSEQQIVEPVPVAIHQPGRTPLGAVLDSVERMADQQEETSRLIERLITIVENLTTRVTALERDCLVALKALALDSEPEPGGAQTEEGGR